MAVGAQLSEGVHTLGVGRPLRRASEATTVDLLKAAQERIDRNDGRAPVGAGVRVGYRCTEALEFLDTPSVGAAGHEQFHGYGGISGHPGNGTAR